MLPTITGVIFPVGAYAVANMPYSAARRRLSPEETHVEKPERSGEQKNHATNRNSRVKFFHLVWHVRGMRAKASFEQLFEQLAEQVL